MERRLKDIIHQSTYAGLVLALLVLAGCGSATGGAGSEALPPAPSGPGDAAVELSDDQLANMEYDYGDGSAVLVDGVYEEKPFADSATFLVRLSLLQSRARGDLNGDGLEDAAVVLVNNPGGSGTFEYLAAVVNRDGEPVNVASVFLGDRVQITALAIVDGRIELDVVTHGPDDPLCCPTLEERRVFELTDGELRSVRE